MKTLKRLVSCLLALSMILSMFLAVNAATNGSAKAAERTGITIDRVTTQNTFGESLTHAEGYYWTDKKLEKIPVTYEAWVYMPSTVTYPQEGNVILSTLPQVYAAGTDNFFSFELKNGSEPKLMFGYNNKSVTEVVFWNEGRVPKDKWTHLVLVHDTVNKTVSCYLNGELKETKEFTFVPDASNIDNPLALAGDRATVNARAFTGILGDVSVYSDVRGAAEVRSDYNFGADVSDENLMLYYQISSDKQEKDLEDLSGNGYDMKYNRVFLTEAEMEEIRAKDDKEYAYSIAFIPDIQILTDYFPNKLPPVFDYVLDNIENKNIKYMVTLGDMTDENTQVEWDRVKEQLDRFNGILPYSLVRGNHDGVWKGQAPIYDSIFADPNSDYYKHVQANGGFYDTSSVKNTYVLFEESGTKYMLLSLDYGITDEKILDWADEVIASHPDHRVIIATHAWLGTTGEPFANGEWSSPSTEVAGSIDPGQMWDEHFRKHANIDMIVCGHTHSDQIMCTPVVGDNGNVVYQVLMDSQFADLAVNGGGKGLGGIGVVGIMYFTEDGQFAKIEYYSTIFERYYYEGHTDISLDFDAEGPVSYSIATDANGNPLNVKVVNGIEWVEENGELKMPAGPSSSFLLFDSELNANRIEATIVIRDNIGTDTDTHRNGLVFALTDHDNDLTFNYNGDDVSYYWAFVTDDDKVEVRKMGKYENWAIIGPASATLTSLGIDVTKGVTLTAEWDDEGHIKVYANGILVQDITDTRGEPLTGSYYGMLVYKYGNSQGPNYAYPYDAPVTSFIAGKTLYENCVDADGNPLNVKIVNGVTWIEKNGNLKMPAGPSSSFLLFDTPLENNRIEATIIIRDNINNDANHRNGLVFALTDHDGDSTITNYWDADFSYYWAFVNDSGCVEVIEMGKYQNWHWLTAAGGASLAALGIDVTRGVTLAAEWDDAGHIKVYANDILVQEVIDPTPLTGDLYGMLVYKYGNSQGPGYAYPYNAPVTSFIAGREMASGEPDEPVVPSTKPESYENCTDADGNLLNPVFVNDIYWELSDGKLEMPAGPMASFLLFNDTLANKRIEATIYPNDLHGSADDRNGLVFALTDHDGDSSFSLGSTDASYYWAFITGWGSIEVAEMGKYQDWTWLSKTQPTLASLGIDPAEGVTLAVEWDDEGHIRVFVNDILVHNLVDATPLTGDLYGMLVRKWGNTGDAGTEDYPYDAPVTSFVAGGESLWDKLEKYTITASTTPQWGGTIIGAGEYTLGGTAILTAVPSEGYVFEGWYENGELVSSSAAYTFTVEANRELTAKFTAGYIYGDANGDAQINMKDLILIRKYIADFNFDTNTSSVKVGVGADVNGDGQINMEDVVLIRKSIINHDYDAESETYALQDITDSLKLHGRTAVTSEGIVCDLSATGIEFSAYVEGAVKLSVAVSADTYFTVYIDGVRQATRYNVKNGTATLTIANFMEGGVHNIRVLKQTESANSLCILQSISFNGHFEEAPAENDLFIEFLGDSITSGYGNLCANGAENGGNALNQDATQTYAYLTAQKLGADHSLVSCSGIGVTSSWSGNFTMKDFFTAQSYHRATGVKYEKTFTPDIVVINLGTNDNSKGSDGAQFKEDAKALITLVRSTYGEDVKIVWATNMMGACMQAYSQAAIEELGGEAAGLYICTLTENREGGGAHPSSAAHASAAATLADFIAQKVLSE